MSTYRITANDTDMGEYQAESSAQALDCYAQDAGYKDYADVIAQFGDEATATVIHQRKEDVQNFAQAESYC